MRSKQMQQGTRVRTRTMTPTGGGNGDAQNTDETVHWNKGAVRAVGHRARRVLFRCVHARFREEMDVLLAREYSRATPAGRVKMRGKINDARDRRAVVVRTLLERQALCRTPPPRSAVCKERLCRAKATLHGGRCAACATKKRNTKIRVRRKAQVYRMQGLLGPGD